MTKIGILRCLLYFPLYPFWRAFFTELDCRLVVSPPLTVRTFDERPRKYVGDICLPIETAFSHAENLQDEVDWIFVPRTNQLHKDIYVCPACAGLGDLLRHALQLPNILSFNLTPFTAPGRSDRAVLRQLGKSGRAIRRAFASACDVYAGFVSAARRTPLLEEAIAANTENLPVLTRPQSADGPRILLLGMPYVLGDKFIGKGIPEMLIRHDCRLVTPFMITPESINEEYSFEGYTMYWTLGGMSVSALLREAKARRIDGVVYCSSFACGVDSCITPVVQSICRRVYDLPYLLLVVDEHSEDAHIGIRIEAFVDSLLPSGSYRRACR